MIGLDTNILVRMLVEDDPLQTAKVHTLMQSLSAEEPGFISHVVLLELSWVLSSRYKYDRAQVAATLELLLRAVGLKFEQRDAVWSALLAYRTSRADFEDCLIERIGRAAGCEYTVTFDMGAARRAGMRLLK